MNACPTHVMPMPVALTLKVLQFVNVTQAIPEMDLIVPVSTPSIRFFNLFDLTNNHFLIAHCFTDINECLTNPCHVNASCNDTEGAFVCQCDAAYSGNGFNCSSK